MSLSSAMSFHEELSAPLLTTDNYLLQPLHISELRDSAIIIIIIIKCTFI